MISALLNILAVYSRHRIPKRIDKFDSCERFELRLNFSGFFFGVNISTISGSFIERWRPFSSGGGLVCRPLLLRSLGFNTPSLATLRLIES